MRRTIFAASLATLCWSTGGCASSLYFHSPELATRAATAKSALEGAKLEAPYDEAISDLRELMILEDRSRLAASVSIRNKQLADIAAADPKRPSAKDRNPSEPKSCNGKMRADLSPRDAALCAGLSRMWNTLTGLDAADQTHADKLAEVARSRIDVREERLRINLDLALLRDRYSVDVAAAGITPRSTTCAALKKVAESEIAADRFGEHLSELKTSCAALDGLKPVSFTPGKLGELQQAIDDAEAVVSERQADEVITAIEKEIADAEKAGKDTAAIRGRALIEKFDSLLGGAKAVASEAGWERIQTELDRAERGIACQADKDSVDEKEREAAKCSELGKDSTSNKTLVILNFAAALAQMKDAGNPALRSAQWISAAKAIVQTRKSAAELALARDREVLNARREQLGYFMREAEALVRGLRALDPPDGAAPQFGVAAEAFAIAWDRGEAPARVLAARQVQADRLLSAQLWKLAASADAALLAAATSQLDEYAKGGLDAKIAADTLWDIGLIGVVAWD